MASDPSVPTAASGYWLNYGLLAAPLSFAALPLYVLLPNHYATQYGIPLGLLGAVLLVARLLDAFVDPWFGVLIDRLLARGFAAVRAYAAIAAGLMSLGFAALWLVPVTQHSAVLVWLFCAMALTFAGYGFLCVLHQGIGAGLSCGDAQQAQMAAFREGATLGGVVLASVLPSVFGIASLVPFFLGLLGLTWIFLQTSLRDAARQSARGDTSQPPKLLLDAVFGNTEFRKLCVVFALNGIAAAIPATLMLFFVKDRLGVADPAGFLLAYFAAAAVSLPIWVGVVKRFGLVPAWASGMALAVLSFVGAAALGPGDAVWFGVVCVGTGLAAGADLAVPSALLAKLIDRAGHRHALEGSYFGVWTFINKLNLALAAGLTLPLLQLLGYMPGQSGRQALWALGIAYCVVPCALKLLALASLWWARHAFEKGEST